MLKTGRLMDKKGGSAEHSDILLGYGKRLLVTGMTHARLVKVERRIFFGEPRKAVKRQKREG